MLVLEDHLSELEAKGNFQELYKRFGGELQKRFGTADERDVENGYALFLQLLVHWELLAEKIEELKRRRFCSMKAIRLQVCCEHGPRYINGDHDAASLDSFRLLPAGSARRCQGYNQ